MKPLVKIVLFSLVLAAAIFSWRQLNLSKIVISAPIQAAPFSISGCDFVRSNSECLLVGSSEIRLWVNTPSVKHIELSLNGSINQNAKKAIHGGFIFYLPIPSGNNQLEISLPKENAQWQISVSKQPAPEWLDAYQESRKNNDLTLATNILNTQIDIDSNFERAQKLYYLGRTYLRNNRLDTAIDSLKKSNQIFHTLGYENKVVDNKTVLIYIYLFLKDDAPSAQSLLSNLSYSSFDAKAMFYLAFYNGHLANYLGELSQAEAFFLKALNIAEKHNLQREKIDSKHMRSRVLLSSGQTKRAVSIRQKIIQQLPDSWSGCKKLIYYNGLGWSQIQLKETEPTSVNPLPALQRALALLDQHCPEREIERINIMLNLSKNSYIDGNLDQARQWLDQVAETNVKLPYRQRLDYIELEALLALKQLSAERAMTLFKELKSTAEQVQYSDFVLKALVGIAQSYESLGDNNNAISYYEQAVKLVFNQTLHIPLTSSQPYFLNKNMNFSSQYVDLLFRMNKQQLALSTARKFRTYWFDNIAQIRRMTMAQLANNSDWARAIGNIKKLRKSIIAQQSLEWTLPQDQLQSARRQIEKERQTLASLFDQMIRMVNYTGIDRQIAQRTPDANELLLFFYPVNNGWLGFAQNQQGIYLHKIDTTKILNITPAGLAQTWISQFESMVDSAGSIRVYPYGQLNQVDFHSLLHRGEPLLQHRQVVFGVDIKSGTSSNLYSNSGEHSLVVANSRGDLKETESEAASVTSLVTKKQWQSSLFMNSHTDIHSVKKLLEQVEHFHYAGHVLPSSSSQEGFFLPLSNNSRLNTTDILMLKRTPKWVVLSACNSGKTMPSRGIASLGLAQAFILSGSQQVIATSRPVRDTEAHLLMKQFYQRWMTDGDFERSFRLAQLDMLKKKPGSDWLAFRIVTS